MDAFMRSVSSRFSQRVDMLKALGSYFTGKLENASALGGAIHAFAGLFFGAAYFGLFYLMGSTVVPFSLFLGLAFGFFHGLIMSYMLMFYASERHPVAEYRKATLEIGLLHLVGHIIFGGVVGLVGGLILLGVTQ